MNYASLISRISSFSSSFSTHLDHRTVVPQASSSAASIAARHRCSRSKARAGRFLQFLLLLLKPPWPPPRLFLLLACTRARPH